MPKTVIEFIRPCGIYVAGDIAGFDSQERAQAYINAKVARAYEEPGEAPKNPPQNPPADAGKAARKSAAKGEAA